MTRRIAVLAGALVATVSFSSCSTFERNDAAAAVNGVELSVEELADVITSPLATGGLPVESAAGDIARNIIEVWLTNTIIVEAGLLDEYDADALREQLAAQIGPDFVESPPAAQELLVVNNAINQAVQSGGLDQADALLAVIEAGVWVNSRYGTWDAPTQSVVAIGDE